MINASEAFIRAMTSPIVEAYVKLELLDKNEDLIDTFTQKINSNSIGDISVDGSRDIRRMFTLTLDNSDGKFTWGENKLIWIDNKRLKLYIGLNTPFGIEYISQGVFVISQPQATHKLNMNTVTISGQDKWYLLSGNFGKFTHELTILKGTNITNAVKIIVENAGIPAVKVIADETSLTVPYDMTYQIGQNRGQAIKDLASKAFVEGKYFFDAYFDTDGYLRFEKIKDPTLDAPVWTYKVEDNTLYAGSVRKLNDTKLYNHILVLGGSSQTAEFRSEIIIDETLPQFSTGHPYSIQKIGDRFNAWNNGNPDSNIDTQSQCDARALYELQKSLRYSEIIQFDLAPNYLHEPNDTVEIIDNANGATGTYELKSFSVPIKPKVVSAEAIKIRKG